MKSKQKNDLRHAPRPAPAKRARREPERLQRTVQHFLHGFHAGLLDTSFMVERERALDMTMSG